MPLSAQGNGLLESFPSPPIVMGEWLILLSVLAIG